MKQALIPKPASRFLLVRCNHCDNETIVYSHVTRKIKCSSCSELLVENTGGKAKINGEIVKQLDNL